MAVEDLREGGHPLESCYQAVAIELLKRKFSPNSAQSVKETHLFIRKAGIANFSLHHQALLAAPIPGEWQGDSE
jgi:hypothetical protein